MKVETLMTSAPLVCRRDSTLADVARLMWQGDCGIVPVADEKGRVIGVVTDRDICVAAWSKNRAPSAIRVRELPRRDVVACRPDDDARTALDLMQEHAVRRLPVTGPDGILKGILSINDVVLAAGHDTGVTASDVLETFKEVCAHRDVPVAV
jgi:CBS domain-containing protein